MIHITILRAMVKAGATLDVVLTAVEADQMLGEQMAQARRARALAARTFRGNGHGREPIPTNVTSVSARRTIQQAASDLLAAVSTASAATAATHGNDPVRN